MSGRRKPHQCVDAFFIADFPHHHTVGRPPRDSPSPTWHDRSVHGTKDRRSSSVWARRLTGNFFAKTLSRAMPATFFFMRTIPLVCGAEIPYDLFSNLAMDLLKYPKRALSICPSR